VSQLPITVRHPQGLFLPRSYVVYRASEAITIDGNLDKKAWWDAPWTEAFEDHQAPNAPAPWRMTRAAMLWDDENIYFAARLQEENVWGSITERDAVIYYDNDFEIFLDVDERGDNYYEFEINPLNTVWDMFHPREYHRRSSLETGYDVEGLRHAVQVQGTLNNHHDTDTGWTVEVAWPWQAIRDHGRTTAAIPPVRGQSFRVNFSRVQYPHDTSGLSCAKVEGSRCEDWIWNSTNCGDLHIPEAWGRVWFSDHTAGTERDDEIEVLAHKPAAPLPQIADPIPTDMVWIGPCTITMGPDESALHSSPAHQIEIEGYWIDRHPVTVAQFAAFLQETSFDEHFVEAMANPHECGIIADDDGSYRVVPGREDHPVVYVTHTAALAYAAWNDRQLPTEAQWERVARGLHGRTYPWGEAPPTPAHANYDYHYGGTTPIGSFPQGATDEGVWDLAGNVKEWCFDEYHPYPGGEPMLDFDETTPDLDWIQQAALTRELFCVRGGGWSKQPANIRSTYRDADGGGRWFFSLGFRTVKLEG
jgi:formylglycine-generating enzyme required for sulfatase activity